MRQCAGDVGSAQVINGLILDDLRSSMEFYSARLNMLADAQAETEKTKQVSTSLVMEVKSLDQGRKELYWATEHELAARTFAA